MSQKRILSVIAMLIVTTLIISGCRVRSASEGDTKKPTDVKAQALVASPSATLEFVESASPEVSPTEPTILPFTDTPTEGSPAATETINVVLPTTSVPDISPTVATVIPDFPTNTPTSFPTDIPPTNTFTPTFTLTPTPTFTLTPSETPTLTPSDTPTPPVTDTFTPFPSLTPAATSVAFQESLVPQQITATYIIQQATNVHLTFDASQGTFVSTATTDPGVIGQTPQVIQPTATFTPAGQFPDCEYYVQPGDTLGQIAITYAMKVDTIAAANGLTNPNFVKAGVNIIIPGCGRNPTPAPSASPTATGTLTYTNETGPVQYTVELGDNIYKLSVRFGVTMRELLNANPSVTDMNAIWVGDTLTIPARTQFGTPTPTISAPVFPTATPG